MFKSDKTFVPRTCRWRKPIFYLTILAVYLISSSGLNSAHALASNVTSASGDSSSVREEDLAALTIIILVIDVAFASILSLIVMRSKNLAPANLLPLSKDSLISTPGWSDFHPRSWLSKFNDLSAKHLLVMGFFFHGIGFGLSIAGTTLLELLNPSYQAPTLPVSFAEAVLAGPAEETLFFGIPFYAAGNVFVVLATGGLWALLHVFNTPILTLNNFAYGNAFFAIAHVIFSLRTWISGKGWFAIIFHSVWNLIVFLPLCSLGYISCSVFGQGGSYHAAGNVLISIFFTELMLLITFLLYKRRKKKPLAT